MTSNTNTGTVLTGEGIAFFQRRAALSALAIEVRSEGRMRASNKGSGLQACRAQGLLEPGKRTTNKAGMRNAVKNMKLIYPNWEAEGTIKMALDKC